MLLSSWLASVTRRSTTKPTLRRSRINLSKPVAADCRVEKLEPRVLLSAVLAGAGNITVTENDPATAINTAVTLVDLGSTTQASGTATISNYVAGQDQLSFTNDGLTMGNIAVSSNVNGTLTLTSAGATATNAEWQAALRAVTYTNLSDNPDTTARIINFTVNDGAGDSNTLANTVNITAVNDAPALSIGGNLNFTENGAASAIDPGLILTDVDSLTMSSATIKINNFVSGQDHLGFTNDGLTMGNIAVSSNTGGTLTLTSAGGTATTAQWQAALRSVTYVNTSDNPNTQARTITISANDGALDSNLLASTVNVTAVNDPSVLTVAGNITFTENSAPVAIATGLMISDVDTNTANTATVKINNFVAGQDQLAFTNNGATMGNIAVSSNANGTLTLTSAGGTATLAQWQDALRAVTYVNTSDNPTTTARNISFTLANGASVSDPLNSVVNIAAVNDAPVLTIGGNLNFTENGVASAIDPGLILNDVDSATLSSATIKINNFVSGQDQLAFTNNGSTMGNIAVASNANGTLTLTSAGGTATVAQWQAALRAVTYVNTSENPNTQQRSISISANDGVSTSNLLASTVNVIAVNDPAVLTGAGNITFTEGGTPLAIATGLNVSDVDSTTAMSAKVKITNFVAGQDQLAFTNNGVTMGNIAVASNANGTLTLTSAGGTATMAQWQEALRAVTYVNTSNNPSTTARNISFTLGSGNSISTPLVSTVNITAIDSAPVLSVGGNVNFTESGPSTAIAPGLLLTDVDSNTMASAAITINNFVNGQDQLAFTNNGTTMGNIAVSSNTNGTLTLTSAGGTATVAQWQAALRSVTYANTSSNPDTQARSISISVNDGTLVSNLLANTVNITAIDTAPVLTGIETTPLAYAPLSAATNVTSTLQVSDVDSALLTGATVRISGGLHSGDMLNFTNTANITGNFNAATGTLTLTGNDTVANYQAALRSITYSSTSTDASARTVSFQVTDGTNPSLTVSRVIGGNIQLDNNGTLNIYGSSCNDVITVNQICSNIVVWRDGVRSVYSASQVSAINVYGNDGNDLIIAGGLQSGTAFSAYGGNGNDALLVGPLVTANVLLDGGAGDDLLIGGRGNDILVGGAGNDVLASSGGSDIMIGGTGRDLLVGSGGDDLMITGSSTLEGNTAALQAVMAEWSLGTSYQSRVDHLLGNTAGGLNGTTVLNSTTVKNDSSGDVVIGGAGQDLYLASSSQDHVYGQTSDELFTNIDTWV